MNTAVKTPSRTVVFLNAWNKAEKIDYNPKWANGTGYFDGAVRRNGDNAVRLEPGQMRASITPGINDRKILFLGTRLGVVAIFQRYTGGENDIYVFNADSRLERARLLHGSSSIDNDGMAVYLSGHDDPENDLHETVETAYEVFKELIQQETVSDLNLSKGVIVRVMDPTERPGLTPEEVDKVLKIEPEV